MYYLIAQIQFNVIHLKYHYIEFISYKGHLVN